MTKFFVDSCIFFAYAYPEEEWNSKSTIFFESALSRFTGERVKAEIERRLKKRKDLYLRLSSFFFKGGKLADFDTSCITNQNDHQHFEDLLLLLSKQLPSEVLAYLRDKDNITRKGIADALGKTQSPLVEMSYDPLCENIIQSLLKNRSDAQIFVDAYYWSEKKGASVFATTDVTDFVKNRVDIHKAMCNYKIVDRIENLPLRILHLNKIV
jgi:hypothetical protein